HAPALEAERNAALAVAELQHRVGREARTQRRRDILVRPVDDLYQRLPERLVGEVRSGHVGAADDERVEPLALDVLERLVVALDVRARLRAALDLLERER